MMAWRLDTAERLCGNRQNEHEWRKEPIMPSVKRLQHTSIPMPPGGDDRARAFYGGVLGMREIQKPEGLAAMRRRICRRVITTGCLRPVQTI